MSRLDDDGSNHVMFLCRKEEGWEVLEQIGRGSAMAELAVSL